MDSHRDDSPELGAPTALQEAVYLVLGQVVELWRALSALLHITGRIARQVSPVYRLSQHVFKAAELSVEGGRRYGMPEFSLTDHIRRSPGEVALHIPAGDVRDDAPAEYLPQTFHAGLVPDVGGRLLLHL